MTTSPCPPSLLAPPSPDPLISANKLAANKLAANKLSASPLGGPAVIRRMLLGGALVAGAALLGTTLVSPPAEAATVPIPQLGCTPSGKTCGGFICQHDTAARTVACTLVVSWPNGS